jgi:TolA-binding protein
MTLTLDNRSKTRESSLTQALRQIQQLNSKIAVLEEQHQDYVQKQQNLISAIAEICVSPMAGSAGAADSDLSGRSSLSAVLAFGVG